MVQNLPFNIMSVDGVTYAIDNEYKDLMKKSRVLLTIISLINNNKTLLSDVEHLSDILPSLEGKYREIGKEMANHLKILELRPLTEEEKEGVQIVKKKDEITNTGLPPIIPTTKGDIIEAIDKRMQTKVE